METTKTSEVTAMCDGVLAAFPQGRMRTKALKAVQWRLRGSLGEFVGLSDDLRCAFVPESKAFVFDGRDNEARKLATYETALGPLTIEVIKPRDC